MSPLLLKEFREARWKLIVGLVLVAGTGISLPLLVDFLEDMAQHMGETPLPERLEAQLAAQLADYRVYLWANWYGKNLLQFAIVLAAVIGGPLIASERGRGTLEFLLSRPISRTHVYLTKVLAGGLVLAIVMGLGTAATLVTTYASDRPVSVSWFLSGLPAQFLGAFCIMSFGVLLSTLLDDGLKAGALAGAAAVVSALLESVRPFRGRLLMGMMTAGRSAATGTPEIVPILVMTGLSIALLWLGLVSFRRQDA